MNAKAFSIGEAIGFGWDVAKKNISFFVLAGIVSLVVSAIPQWLGRPGRPGSLVFGLIGFFVSGVLTLGWIKIGLRFCDNQKPQWSDLYSQYRLFLRYWGVAILYGLIVLGGFILLIVPGIIWAIRFGYAITLLVDRNVGVMDALRMSSAITLGARWNVFLLNLVLAAITILGGLAFGIGLFWALPAVLVASVYVYRKLLAQTPLPQLAATG